MAWTPPIVEVIYYPVSLITVIVNVIVCYILNSRNVQVTSVATSSDGILVDRQYWRIITATFSHYSILHIIANVSSSWACRRLEMVHGASQFLVYVTVLMLSSNILDALIRRWFLPQTTQTLAVGYSGVVCGLMAIFSAESSGVEIFGVRIPWSIMPFINIVLISLLIPQASFIGHLAGVIMGFLISWHIFDWITVRLFWNLIPWIAFFFFANWVRWHRDAVTWFVSSTQPPAPQMTVVGGRLERV
jgi:membrane associated rhomboid family serine protease